MTTKKAIKKLKLMATIGNSLFAISQTLGASAVIADYKWAGLGIMLLGGIGQMIAAIAIKAEEIENENKAK